MLDDEAVADEAVDVGSFDDGTGDGDAVDDGELKQEQLTTCHRA